MHATFYWLTYEIVRLNECMKCPVLSSSTRHVADETKLKAAQEVSENLEVSKWNLNKLVLFIAMCNTLSVEDINPCTCISFRFHR